jgi:hypothetical protein
MTGQDEPGEAQWSERRLVIRRARHAKQQQAGFSKRLETAETAVKAAVPKGTESVAEWQVRLNKTLKEQGVREFLTVPVPETAPTGKHGLRPGRPTANTPYRWETCSELSCRVERQEAAIQAHQPLMGWRIDVTNAPKTRMTLRQSSG